MKTQSAILTLLILSLSFTQFGMARNAVYDEEAREAERQEKEQAKLEPHERKNPAKEMASGVKEATVGSAGGFISETADGTVSDAPVVGTVEGARVGSGKVLDSTLKGAVKVATLGYGELNDYEVEDPAKDSEETTKIKIKIPGT